MTFTIPLNPCSKKNSKEIAYNHKTKRNFLVSNHIVLAYETECVLKLKLLNLKIEKYPVLIKMTHYRDSNISCDVSNLGEVVLDCMVKAGILKDDNFKYITEVTNKWGGVDKTNPRTEVMII